MVPIKCLQGHSDTQFSGRSVDPLKDESSKDHGLANSFAFIAMWASQLQNFCTRSSDAWAARRDVPNDTGTHRKQLMRKLPMLSLHQDPVLDAKVTSVPPFALALLRSSSLANVSGQCADIAHSTCSSSCFYLSDFVNIRKTSPNKAADVFTLRFYETHLAIIPGIFSSRSSVHLGQVIEMETAG